MLYRVLALLAVVGAFGGGCTSPGRQASPLATRNVITADEIARVNATTALEAIQRLQPAMLTKHRGPTSFRNEAQSQINVYVDGSRFGGVGSLSLIEATSILEIRFLSAADATFRYGTGNSAGAIDIKSRT